MKTFDAQKLRKHLEKAHESLTLNESELIGASIGALEVMERCGLRDYASFELLLEKVADALSVPE